MPREELRSRLKLSPDVFNPLIAAAVEDELVVEEGTLLRQPNHQINFSANQETAVASLLRRMSAAGVASPSVKDCKTAVGDDVYFALLDLGQLKQLNNDVVYATPDYEKIKSQIIQFLQNNSEIDAAQTRDRLKTSRKYATALLEHLDDIKVTKRVDDKRVLR